MKRVNVGLIGFGTVGTGVVKTLQKNSSLLAKKVGAEINLKWVCDLDLNADRGVKLPDGCLTDDLNKVMDDPEVDIVIELIGGCGVAKKIILGTLSSGKSVVTANKALLAEHGEEIFSTEESSNGVIGYEASVAGGIPIIKALREGLCANNVYEIYGIINGTANYILTKMSSEKQSFDEALKDAQRLGYAEADPTFDVDGIDTAHKLLLLGSLSSHTIFRMDDIFIEGIRKVTEKDIEYAGEFGYVIKLLAIYKNDKHTVQLRVHPTLIPKDKLLSSVKDSYNAVFINSDIVGSTLYSGRGAGELPTASAVVADVVDIAKSIVDENTHKRNDFYIDRVKVKVKDISDISTRYYLRFQVTDQPNVLSKIAGVLGEKGISISDVFQKERRVGDNVPLIMITHHATESAVREALCEISRMSFVKEETLVLRMEE